MNIQEAIRKAGPGGKIRRGKWHNSVPNMVIPESSRSNIKHETGSSGMQTNSPALLLADDWEVVEPEVEIQVGDWVAAKEPNYMDSACNKGKCRVMCIYRKDFVLLLNEEINCHCSILTASQLKFVSRPDKGKVHVFEDVEWQPTGTNFKRTIPTFYGNNNPFDEFLGKRTRVTVEEL